ncbi:MAG: hypothetical protein A2171_01985 [Candidatus Levybacteria bacterium RBG_13_35_9]|nr:MAG: hypothetical protein A2171_01985 [Candidatus Levybacteria bacterium RBG_13_35_9]
MRTLCFAAGRIRPQNTSKAEPALKLARSERPSERPVCPSPSEGKRSPGDMGAPTGAVHY